MRMKKLILLLGFILSCYLVSCGTAGTGLIGSITQPNPAYRGPIIDLSKEAQANLPYRSLDTSKELTTIGFGSCVDQNLPQPVWDVVQSNNPDLFLMMGDNVYASKPEDRPFIDQYIKLNSNPSYRKLRESIPFLATWDDHDFGQNDGGFDNPDKEEARRSFLNYWGYLKQTLPKKQKAIYHSRLIGTKNKQIQFIMLDTRWDRSPLLRNTNITDLVNTTPKLYTAQTDPKQKIISEEQWTWLEVELRKPARFKIIISSIQVIADDHGFEKWGNFPLEKERLFNLLKKTKSSKVLFLSGDRHLASLAKAEIKGLGLIYDITGSSLNKASKLITPELDPSYVTETFNEPNFGLIKLNWDQKKMDIEIRDLNNQVKISHTLML